MGCHMGIIAKSLKEAVIYPTLLQLNQWSPATEALLLGTASAMSNLGETLFSEQPTHLYGLYQLDKLSHRQIWDNHLAYNSELASTVRGFASQRLFLNNPEQELITNLAYATAIAWATYDAKTTQLPEDPHNLLTLATCWYEHYPNLDLPKEKAIRIFIDGLKAITESPNNNSQLVA